MEETVLLVGGGGREHVIARSLAGSEASLFACAGNRNPGIARLADGFETLETTNPTAVRAYADEVGATLSVVGPEAPLEAGVADALDEADAYERREYIPMHLDVEAVDAEEIEVVRAKA